MPKNIIANKWLHFSLVSLAILYMLTISMNVSLRDYHDDAFYLSAFEKGETLNFLYNQYMTWSGRVLIDALTINTIGHRYFWLTALPLSILLLGYASCKIISHKPCLALISLFIIIFATMPNQVLNDSVFWVTGFYNYLLPVSIAFYVFSVFITKESHSLHKIASIPLAFYISYMEQTALCFLVAATIAFMAKREFITKFNAFLFFIVLVNFIICIKSPGSESRLYLETWNRMPQFKYYTPFIKFSLGLDKLNELVIYVINIPLIIFSALLVYYHSTLGRATISVRVSIICVTAYVLIQTTRILSPFISSHFFFNIGDISGDNFYTFYKYFSYACLTMLLACLLTIMLSIISRDKSFIFPSSALILGAMSVTVLGFSPTVFISGFRVDFVFEVMCAFMSVFMINKIIH